VRLRSCSRQRRAALAGLICLICLGAGVRPTAAQGERDVPEVVRELLDAASRAQERGRLDEAIANYRQALELGPQVVRGYVALGALYHQRGQREEALEVFRRGLEQAPTEQALLTNTAAVALELGQAELALELAERAVAAAPKDADLRFLHGAVLRRLDRAEEAVATLQQGLSLRPKDPRLLFSLGNAHQQLAQLEPAIAAFRAAIKADRDYLPAHYNLGAVLFEAQRFGEAQEAYEVALAPLDKALAQGEAVDPVHAQAYLNLGAIFLQEKDWRRALDAYGKAARLTPDSAVAHFHLGYALFQLGDTEAARTTYQRALALDPNLPVAHLHLAEIEAQNQRPTAVIDHLRTVVEELAGADQERALVLLATAHQETGDDGAAEAAYRRLRQTRPTDPAVAVALGRILRRQGRREEARPFLEEALATSSHGVVAGLELAALARASGDLAAEKAVYLQVLEHQQDDPALLPVRINLALVLLQQGDRDAARQRLEGLLPKLSGHHALRTVYAMLLLAEGERDTAEETLRALLRQSPAGGKAATAVAAAVAAGEAFRGDASAAVTAFQSQWDAATDDSGLLARANLGQALWLAGRGADARPHLQAASEAFPRWPGLRVALGEIALAADDLPSARDHLEAALVLCRTGTGDHNPIASTTPAEDGDGGRTFRLLVQSPGADAALCQRARQHLGAVEARQAFQALSQNNGGRALALAERALAAPLAAPERALAHLARGSAFLLRGSDEAARRDLTAALGGDLAPSLRPLAQNNLGVALHRLGRTEDARRQFTAANTGSTSPAATLLNLGITAEAEGDGAAALALYERYLASDAGRGARRAEVAEWVDKLRRVYR